MPLDYPDPRLESDLVRLRRWEYRDLPCVEAATTDPNIPLGTTVPPVFTEREGRAFIERQWSRQTSGSGLSFAVADVGSDSAVGLVFLGLDRVRGQCRLGYWLIPSARGQGRGTQAVRLASRWVLNETHVHRLVARVALDNEASLTLLRRLGFVKEGVLRSWLWIEDTARDAVQFSLLESDLVEGAI
ncbi:MAG: GNAT family N-acetyltransferase [Acidimicrobiia bacterium]|nr:GNAT family N-acetyltransferase [Acidimicrobiia bacterium]